MIKIYCYSLVFFVFIIDLEFVDTGKTSCVFRLDFT